MPGANEGSILAAIIWMVVLSVLLFWLPILGPLIAGFVGGQKAGGVAAGIVAVILPAVILGGLSFVFATAFSGIPIIGMLAGAGTLVFALSGIGPLLLGAIIGGILA